jgi:hypothetical protein
MKSMFRKGTALQAAEKGRNQGEIPEAHPAGAKAGSFYWLYRHD